MLDLFGSSPGSQNFVPEIKWVFEYQLENEKKRKMKRSGEAIAPLLKDASDEHTYLMQVTVWSCNRKLHWLCQRE